MANVQGKPEEKAAPCKTQLPYVAELAVRSGLRLEVDSLGSGLGLGP